MPSSEEESQWLVGSGGVLAPSGGSATKTGAGERGASTRSGLYTEEMTTQPASVATAGVNSASADSAEHDLIDSTADATLLAQFHEDAIKQVLPSLQNLRIPRNLAIFLFSKSQSCESDLTSGERGFISPRADSIMGFKTHKRQNYRPPT